MSRKGSIGYSGNTVLMAVKKYPLFLFPVTHIEFVLVNGSKKIKLTLSLAAAVFLETNPLLVSSFLI
jgi:hypothetical protein